MMASKPRILSEWLDYIGKTHAQDIDLGLSRVRQVFVAMNLKVDASQVVTVAGTNGKGSTIAMIEAGLNCSGLSVGSYTSPHIQTYNERVKVNGKPVSNKCLEDAFARVEAVRVEALTTTQASVPLTYFEFGTLAAIDILFRQELDVVLLEVGLGGRLDAVNVIDANLAIITSIGYDHTEWLGESLSEIGKEKAGILRSKQLALLGENLPSSVYEHADQLGTDTLKIKEDFGRSDSNVFLSNYAMNNKELSIDGHKTSKSAYSIFPQQHLPDNNILLSLQAIKLLCDAARGKPEKIDYNYRQVVDCISALTIPGRLEKVAGPIDIYLDVGHNSLAAEYLYQFLQLQKCSGKSVRVVYSSLEDKNVSELISILTPVVDFWFVAPLFVPRALDQKTLETEVGAQAKNMLSFASIADAVRESIKTSSGQNTLVLIFGSFYVVEAAKAYFEGL